MDFSHVVKMADSECASPSRSLSSSTHSESVASASDSEHESNSYASSSLGHLRPPPRKDGNYKSMGQESPSVVGVFDVVLKNTEIGCKNTEIYLRAY